ncbi:hypothetical protein LSH36_33g04033 [Paralvinella palmiformis]|uniref:HTH CENPB-type domain-containing protein n=1 Tax=Paralvinella palmiformis TaxID=53620 RepID=A0AAD9K8B4_9ANNE|nr:hypothetical protein LSH36_33g04033 [Paralvinella palmiformis]
MARRRNCCVSVATKLKALDEVDRRVKSKTEIAKRYGVPASTLSTWIKNSQSLRRSQGLINLSCKRRRMGKFANLDAALAVWCKNARAKKVMLSGQIVRAKARDIASTLGVDGFQCSDGWLSRFKQRYRISFRTKYAVHEDEVNVAIEEGADLLPPQAPTESLDLRPALNLVQKQEADSNGDNQPNIVSASMPVFSVFRDVRENAEANNAARISYSNIDNAAEGGVAIKQEPEDPETLSWEETNNIDNAAEGGVAIKQEPEDPETLSWVETNQIRVQLGLKPLSVEKVTKMKPRSMPISAKSRNSNLLQATLHLIKELDAESLEVISDAIRNRLESL